MASEDSEDEMLKAAIKASLEEAQSDQNLTQSSSMVDLTNDSGNDSDVQVVFPKSNSVIGSDTDDEASEEDDDLKLALALSMGKSPPKIEKSPKVSPEKKNLDVKEPARDQPNTQGFMGLDRKKMEQERLMRLGKRKASAMDSEPDRPVKAAKASPSQSVSIGSTSKHVIPGTGNWVEWDPDFKKNVSAPLSTSTPISHKRRGMQWPTGTVKKTQLTSSPRKHNEVSLEEILQKDDLELAVLSSFLWDMEWVLKKLDTRRTRMLFVVHAPNEARPEYEADAAGIPNLRFCFPSLDGQINIMHSKLMLLFHPEYLRIVVPTANLIPVDWGEYDIMENTVFTIDLPLKTKEKSAEARSDDTGDETSTQFYKDLIVFLKASSYPQGIIDKLAKFDFCQTSRYAFVHSIGGAHIGESWKLTGYTGLGRAVSNLGLKPPSHISVDFVTSSLGALNEDLLRAIFLACKGDDGTTDYQFRNTAPSAKAKSPLQEVCQEWKNRFRVYFPSDYTVNHIARSRNRRTEDIGGTVCFSSKYWESPKFPRDILMDCPSKRSVMMHNKIIFVKSIKPIPLQDDAECPGWAYVGSANLSESAWGRLVKDRATGQPKLNCRNWECGVIVPITREKRPSPSNIANTAPVGLDVDLFNSTIPVPMRSSSKIADMRDTKPWFFMG